MDIVEKIFRNKISREEFDLDRLDEWSKVLETYNFEKRTMKIMGDVEEFEVHKFVPRNVFNDWLKDIKNDISKGDLKRALGQIWNNNDYIRGRIFND